MKFTNKQKRDFVKDDYNAIANLYANEDRNLKLYSPYIDKFLKTISGKNVLDVGCAGGEFSNYIATCGFNVTGVDFSDELLAIAKSRYNNIKFVNCDIAEFKTNVKFDGIYTKDTLFHLPDEDLVKVIKSFKNLLNKNGKLLVILDIPKQAGEEIYDEPLDTNYKLYYNYLTVDKIKTLLTNGGFKIDSVEYINDSTDLYVYAQGIMVIYASV